MVERLTKDRNVTKIAILYQDDGFGRAGLAGVEKALEKRNMKLVAEGTFERNTVAVKSALLTSARASRKPSSWSGRTSLAPNSSSWHARSSWTRSSSTSPLSARTRLPRSWAMRVPAWSSPRSCRSRKTNPSRWSPAIKRR